MKYDLNINAMVGEDGLKPGMYPVIIYQLLRQYTNAENKITLDDIVDTLYDYWNGDTNKKSSRSNILRTVKRNLEIILYFDSSIRAEYKDGSEYYVDSGKSVGKIHKIWYESDLSYTDLQFLSDAVVYSRHLSANHRIELLEKLMCAAGQRNLNNNEWFINAVKDSKDLSVPIPGDLYQRMDFVNYAINEKVCIHFDFCLYGPNGIKQKIKHYSDVSPYKIIHEDGIYYMIGAEKKKHPNSSISSGGAHNVICLEIHKMESLGISSDDAFIPADETDIKGLSINDLLSKGFNEYSRKLSSTLFDGTVNIGASILGLDALNDRFGERMNVIERKDYTAKKAVSGEIPYRYEISIKNVAKNDWYDILILLLRYPILDLGLLNDSVHYLETIYEQIGLVLNRNVHGDYERRWNEHDLLAQKK